MLLNAHDSFHTNQGRKAVKSLCQKVEWKKYISYPNNDDFDYYYYGSVESVWFRLASI